MALLRSLLYGSLFLWIWLWALPFQVLGLRPALHAGVWAVAGAVVFAAGAALVIWCVMGFVTLGRGTPAPFDPPTRLVVAGPYRWVRNPMYLGLFLLMLGEAAALHSVALAVSTLLVAAVAHAFVAGYEERALERHFGDDYAAYAARVRRWLPRRPRP